MLLGNDGNCKLPVSMGALTIGAISSLSLSMSRTFRSMFCRVNSAKLSRSAGTIVIETAGHVFVLTTFLSTIETLATSLVETSCNLVKTKLGALLM